MIVIDRTILRQKSEPAVKEKDDVSGILHKLRVALDSSKTEGCGLSAIQIGIPKAVAIIRYGGKELILVNPKIISHSETKNVAFEGCLSIPKSKIQVRRFDSIKISNDDFWENTNILEFSDFDHFGVNHKNRIVNRTRQTGYLARIVQHEIDHMNGILIVDKKFKSYKKKK